ncbi:putative WD40 repeat-containing protein [Verrucomicrobia bacterium]|nr:putative WD40 repeat-containing protein [Verrucomicrobiota bacterium]
MSEPSLCRSCGASLPGDAPSVLCSACASIADSPTVKVEVSPATSTPAPLSEKPGDHIDRYKLLQQIGEGGCGVVYMAEQLEPVRRRVALKVIKLGMDTKQVVARFEAERQALALMDHPHIAKVLDAGATELGRPFFVMELVRGIPITRYCDENKLPMRQRLELFTQVCLALQHAHQKGIIHRDIKPSNILVEDHDGRPIPKVIDFGIAKATASQSLTEKTLFTAFEQFIGTPAYMSPEQAKLSGLDIDTRSDIYSLGVLLYELLTGRTPFDSSRLARGGFDEIRRIIRDEDPPRPSTRLSTLDAAERTAVASQRHCEAPKLLSLIRGDLDWIVMKTLEKDRARRYETANALAMEVRRYLNTEPIVARPPSARYRLEKLVRRNKLVFAAAGAVAAALLAGLGVSTWLLFQERQARRQAVAAERAQAQQRALAQAAELRAQEQSRLAEARANEVNLTLASSDLSRAISLIADDKANDALVYLSRSLAKNPANVAAVTRLATLLTYHSWLLPVPGFQPHVRSSAAHFNSQGTRIATSHLETARVWDARTGAPVTPALRIPGRADMVAFSPDGKRVLAASQNGIVQIWDAQTGRALAGPFKHDGEITAAEFSPDNQHILTASADGTARVWDAQSGQALFPALKHESRVTAAHFSPDGRQLATASENSAQVWDARTGEAVGQPLKHRNFVASVAFSSDGQRVVTASHDRTACVWDAQTGRLLTGPLRHDRMVTWAQFTPEGKRVVTIEQFDKTARVWDAQTGQPLAGPMKHDRTVQTGQISPDGQRLATAAVDNVRLWQIPNGLPLSESLSCGTVVSLQFSPNGSRLLSASPDQLAMLWDTRCGQVLAERVKPGGPVLAATFSPDGNRLLTASDKAALLWDAQTSRQLPPTFAHAGVVRVAQFSPDGNSVLTASADGTARLWDATSGQPLTGPLRHSNAVEAAEFSLDAKRVLTCSSDKTARVWDPQTGLPVTPPLTHEGTVLQGCFSRDGRRVVTASADGTARVWDALSGHPLTEPLHHRNVVREARFSPDGKQVVTACADGTARLWDAETGRPIGEPMFCRGVVNTVEFDPQGKRILTASGPTARVWDAATGQQLTDPMEHDLSVLGAGFSPDGSRIVTRSLDGTARVWEAESGFPLTEPLRHATFVHSAQFSPDGQRVLTASADGTARVWEISPPPDKCPDWLIELAQAVSGRVLNSHGVLAPVTSSQSETIKRIRAKLEPMPADDAWANWGRWFLADRAIRPISPFSKVTVPEYLENRIKEDTAESLAEAEQLAVGNPDLLLRIAKAQQTLAHHL